MQDDSLDIQQKTDQEILDEAKARFQLVEEAESEIRDDAIDDYKFYAGDQWPDVIKTQRSADGRPCLTINRLPQFVRQVTNDQRKNRPSIKVYPVGDGADEVTAKLLQGMIKHIETNSNADVAYDTAFEGAVIAGRGYFRIVADYCDALSFNQKLMIKQILNPSAVFLDPSSKEPDGSDANFGFVVDSMQKSQFNKEYPDAVMSSLDDWGSLGLQHNGWIEEDQCRVSEYYSKEWKPQNLALLSNGDVINLKDVDDTTNFGYHDAEKTKPVRIVKKRKTLVPEVHHFKITATDILERTIWPCEWIPIIPAYGDRIELENQTVFSGIIRNAKDPQRMLNYWTSSETETIALAPKAPWIIAAGQDEGYEEQWRTANTKNHSALKYNPLNIAGQPVPPPVRNVFEPPVAAITNAKGGTIEDLKATTGVYDAALGSQGQEISGIAIQNRNKQIETSNYHYNDNFSRSQRHAGRILVCMIPHIYDTKRIERITNDDGSQDMVEINSISSDGQKINDLSVGEYDVTVDTGPSFASRRQEAAQSMENVLKVYPQLINVMGDLLFKNFDWPGADQMAERIKKTIPANLLDDGKGEEIPPQAQAQMQQMQQMILQLSQSLKAAQEIIENKKLELGSKERIEAAKLQVDIEKLLAQLQSSDAQSLLKHQLAMLQARQDQLLVTQPLSPSPQPNSNPQGPGSPAAAYMGPKQQPTGGSSPG